MGSVGFLFRLGVAIEKLGKHVSEIGRGPKVHPESRCHLSFSGAAEVIRDLNQGNPSYAAMNVALGNEVNKNSGVASVKNVDLLVAQVNSSGLSQGNSPLLSEYYARYAASLNRSLVESRGK